MMVSSRILQRSKTHWIWEVLEMHNNGYSIIQTLIDLEEKEEWTKTKDFNKFTDNINFYRSYYDKLSLEAQGLTLDDVIKQLEFVADNRIYSEKFEVIEDIWSMIQSMYKISKLDSLLIDFSDIKSQFGEYLYSQITSLCFKVCLSKNENCNGSAVNKVLFHKIKMSNNTRHLYDAVMNNQNIYICVVSDDDISEKNSKFFGYMVSYDLLINNK